MVDKGKGQLKAKNTAGVGVALKENKKKGKNPSVHHLCDPGWFRRTEKYAATCSPLNTLQSEVHVSP